MKFHCTISKLKFFINQMHVTYYDIRLRQQKLFAYFSFYFMQTKRKYGFNACHKRKKREKRRNYALLIAYEHVWTFHMNKCKKKKKCITWVDFSKFKLFSFCLCWFRQISDRVKPGKINWNKIDVINIAWIKLK